MTVLQPTPRLQQAAFWMTGVVLWSFWNVGTLVGALAGGAIDPETFGLDVAFPAAFVAMVWPQLRTRRGARAAGIGAAICLALTPPTPVGVPIPCASLAVPVGSPAPPGDDVWKTVG